MLAARRVLKVLPLRRLIVMDLISYFTRLMVEVISFSF